MTVAELSDRITLDEVDAWSVVCGMEAEEREDEMKRVELRSRVQQGIKDARGKLRAA